MTAVDGGLNCDATDPWLYLAFAQIPAKVIGMDTESGFRATRWRFD